MVSFSNGVIVPASDIKLSWGSRAVVEQLAGLTRHVDASDTGES